MLTQRARQLRKNQTLQEEILWKHLRNRRFHDAKFRRQMPIGRFIVDFASVEHKLIIELDGSHHANQKEYDEIRTAFLEAEGYRVIRFWNNQIMKEINGVLQVIEDALKS
ncbi:MAG: endonuclease domain-containing protein [Chloroflexota bacterium]